MVGNNFYLNNNHQSSIKKGFAKIGDTTKIFTSDTRKRKNYTNKRNVKNSKHNRFRSVSGSCSSNVTFAVLPEPATNRQTAERKTAVGAPTDRTTALVASSLHPNRPALWTRVLRARSRNNIDRLSLTTSLHIFKPCYKLLLKR